MSLVIKVNQAGVLQSFIPKKVWYALFKQNIIVRDGTKWKVDLTKRDQIQIPLEIGGSVFTPMQPNRQTRKSAYATLKTIFNEALAYAEQQTEAYKKRIHEELPIYAVGEPVDMLSSLNGKSSDLKNIQGFMIGNCGFAWITGFKLNTQFGRFILKWEKEGNAPFRLSKSSRYGHYLYPELKALTGGPMEAQCMELKSKAYHYFIEKLNELFKTNKLKPIDLYVRTRID